MKISVIVPTYKPQAYLWECLDSIYNQTFPNSDYELLLILNGCNEPHNTQIMEWISKHPDLIIQYFQIDEGGVPMHVIWLLITQQENMLRLLTMMI